MEVIICPICRSEDATVSQENPQDYEYGVIPTRRLRYYACPACNSEVLIPRPTESELLTFYPDHYHAYNEDHGWIAGALVSFRSRQRSRYYQKLVGRSNGKLFDVGTGDCRHFDELKEFCDFEFSGVEIKPEMVAKARQRGYQVVEGTLESMDLAGQEDNYDIVSMNHLIEHVIDPQLLVKKALILLRSGGVIMGQLPTNDSWERRIFNQTWGGYHFPRHLQAFSRQGLKQMLESAGFIDVRVKSTPHLQTAISMQNFLLSRGWKPTMQYGKSPIYSLLLLAVAPFELLAYLFGKTGIIDFEARKP